MIPEAIRAQMRTATNKVLLLQQHIDDLKVSLKHSKDFLVTQMRDNDAKQSEFAGVGNVAYVTPKDRKNPNIPKAKENLILAGVDAAVVKKAFDDAVTLTPVEPYVKVTAEQIDDDE